MTTNLERLSISYKQMHYITQLCHLGKASQQHGGLPAADPCWFEHGPSRCFKETRDSDGDSLQETCQFGTASLETRVRKESIARVRSEALNPSTIAASWYREWTKKCPAPSNGGPSHCKLWKACRHHGKHKATQQTWQYVQRWIRRPEARKWTLQWIQCHVWPNGPHPFEISQTARATTRHGPLVPLGK